MQTMVSTAGGALLHAASAAADAGEREDLALGAKAGPWVVERELGRGGMGSVYAVTHEEIGKRAALKVMHRHLVTSNSAERILLEARVVNQVGHPNIVDIFETGALADGRPYIVMERLEGVPLSYRADEGKILPDQVIGILLQICDALIAAHAANVVHRDLKLDNIFLIDNPDDPTQPRIKLLDWGIAKILSNDARHTIDGQLVGTPQYLSPEQARGATVTPQSDVYSLGVMAFELFLEQLPFEAETSAEIMAMHLRATPPPPSELWPDIPPGLEHLLLAMLAKDPDARPTMLTVAHTLELVRSELQRRCREASASEHPVASVLPSTRRSYRSLAGPGTGLAPTEEAAWPDTHHRWHVAIGAFALAASAALFLFTRDTDPADASPQRSIPVDEAAANELAADERGPMITRDLEHAIAEAPPPVVAEDETPGEPAALADPPPIVERAAQRPTPSVRKPKQRATRPSARKAQVKPRLEPPIDPDGTLDPYL